MVKILKKIRFFNKGIEKQCAYCIHSKAYLENEEILCKYRGVVEADNKCRKFKYDILKRKPNKLHNIEEYTSEDFVL